MKYVIRVDGLTEEKPEYLTEDGGRTFDKKDRDVIDNRRDADTVCDNVKHACGFEAARVVPLRPRTPRVEYATTVAMWEPGTTTADAEGHYIDTVIPEAPILPQPTGWTLVGSAATAPSTGQRYGWLFWFWKKQKA